MLASGLNLGPDDFRGPACLASDFDPNREESKVGDELSTTVMLRNIPNKYTRQLLIDQLHKVGFRGDIDYMYLPVDFANRCNVGYCFLNFRTSLGRSRFQAAFHNVAAKACLPGFNTNKVCQVTTAKWQGRDENVRRIRSGQELMAQLTANPEWLPLLLDETGTEEPFPLDAIPKGAGRGGRKPKRINDIGAGNMYSFPSAGCYPMDPWSGMSMMPAMYPPMVPVSMGPAKGGKRGGKSQLHGGSVDPYLGMPMPVAMMGMGAPYMQPYDPSAAFGALCDPSSDYFLGWPGRLPEYSRQEDTESQNS